MSRRLTFDVILLSACLILAAVLIAYPLLMLLIRGTTNTETGAFTLAKYGAILANNHLFRALANTAIITVGTTALATGLGVALAFISARTNTPFRSKFEILNMIPFFLSPYVGAFAWTHLASPRVGLLNRFALDVLHFSQPPLNIYSLGGIIWVMALFQTPVVFLFTAAALRKMDATLEEAARSAGASPLGTVFHVTIPLVTPAVLAAGLFAFVYAAGSFDVPLALGNPVGINTLSLEIFLLFSDYPVDFGQAAAISTFLLILTGGGILVQRKIMLSRSFTTVTGKGYRPRLFDLGPWRYVALAGNVLFLACAVVLPTLALLVVSLSRSWRGFIDPSVFTLDNYTFVLFGMDISRRALVNSLILSASGATLGMVFATTLANVIFRSRVKGRTLLDLLTTVPIAVPGIVFAMGLLLAWIRTPLYGTLGILLLAYVATYLPLGQRSVVSVLLNISVDLEESARVCGAGWLTTLTRVSIPLLKPGILAGWLILFIIFVRELGVSILLSQSGTEVISVALYQMQIRDVTYPAAFSIIQTMILVIAIFAMRRLAREQELAL